tara:strand:+ start:308 stop:469 length:162 start_codon:yes stop_codon:yes gene_type:complete
MNMLTDKHIEVILAVCNNTQFSLVPSDYAAFYQALTALKESHSKESVEVNKEE